MGISHVYSSENIITERQNGVHDISVGRLSCMSFLYVSPILRGVSRHGGLLFTLHLLSELEPYQDPQTWHDGSALAEWCATLAHHSANAEPRNPVQACKKVSDFRSSWDQTPNYRNTTLIVICACLCTMTYLLLSFVGNTRQLQCCFVAHYVRQRSI